MGSDDVCRYSSADSTDFGQLSWRYLLPVSSISWRALPQMRQNGLGLVRVGDNTAPVTKLRSFVGEQIDLTVFVRFPVADGWYEEASYAQPIYLDLNGPQSPEKYHFSIETGISF